MITQPNITYVYREYSDTIDHHIALTENGVFEALLISGFGVSKHILRSLLSWVTLSLSRSTKVCASTAQRPPNYS